MGGKFFSDRRRWLVLGAALGITLSVILSFSGNKKSPWFPGRRAATYRFSLTQNLAKPRHPRELEEKAKSSKSPSAWAELASAYFHQGRQNGGGRFFSNARDAAKRSLALLPIGNPAKLTLAKIADAEHRFEEALQLARELQRERPSAEIFPVLISSLLAKGDLDEAQRMADQALLARPESRAYLQHALVLAARGRDEEAAYDFKRAALVEDLGAEEDSARLRALWARFLMNHADYVNAKWLLEESLRIVPRYPLALGLQGEWNFQRGKFSAAAEKFHEAFLVSRQPHYLIRYAQMKKTLGQDQGSAELLQSAEKLVREEMTRNTGHRLELVEILLEKKEKKFLEEALMHAKEEIQVRQSGDAYFMLARAWAKLDRLPEAQLALRTALATGARRPDWYRFAATIEEKLGDGRRAEFYRTMAVASK